MLSTKKKGKKKTLLAKYLCWDTEIENITLDFLINQGKEGNVLFNDVLNTFYLQIYGVRFRYHSAREKNYWFVPVQQLIYWKIVLVNVQFWPTIM